MLGVNTGMHMCFLLCFFVVPHLATYILLSIQLLNEPGLGEGIDPGIALTPFPSSIILDEIRTHNLPFASRVH